MLKLYDSTKKGTLILSSYRCGTHFLELTIANTLRDQGKAVLQHDEIDDIQKFDEMAQSKTVYHVAILNSNRVKWYFVRNPNLLREWHVVWLTRADTVGHWISFYIWYYYNTAQERIDNTNLPHNGGVKENYVGITAKEFNIDDVYLWLNEQTVNHLFKVDETIDYQDLPNLSAVGTKWTPNQHGFSLEDLFVNHDEIRSILSPISYNE